MSGNAVRTKSVAETIAYQLPDPIDYAKQPTGDLFASNVFSLAVMKERLPSHVFKSLQKPSRRGKRWTCPPPTPSPRR